MERVEVASFIGRASSLVEEPIAWACKGCRLAEHRRYPRMGSEKRGMRGRPLRRLERGPLGPALGAITRGGESQVWEFYAKVMAEAKLSFISLVNRSTLASVALRLAFVAQILPLEFSLPIFACKLQSPPWCDLQTLDGEWLP